MKNLTSPTIISKIATFCGICDNYTGKNKLGCRVLMPSEQVVRISLDDLCKSGLIEGHKAHVGYDYVEIDGKKYSRKDLILIYNSLYQMTKNISSVQ